MTSIAPPSGRGRASARAETRRAARGATPAPPSGDETLYIHSDHLGSPDTLTSGTGATFTQTFDAFGAPDPDNAELLNPQPRHGKGCSK
jgi:uncharacterized protein RhaS with RHS repeats